jgi:hypothetical protein
MLNSKFKFSSFETGLTLVLFLVFIIYFIPAPNHEIRLHDEFDGNFTSRHLIIHSGSFFETNPAKIVYGTMNGLPRANFFRFTEPVTFLMYLFGSLTGYAIAFILMRIAAFAGIFLLGRDHLNFEKENKGLLLLISLCFACLPLNTSYFLSIAGIPLAVWAFLNIKNDQKVKRSFLALVLFAVGSNFVLVGFHSCFVFGCIALYYSFRQKKIQWKLLGAVIVLGITYVLTEYQMFYMHFFNHEYVSSRQGFEKVLTLNVKGVLGITFTNVFTGEYNAANYFGYLFIPFIFYYVFLAWKNRKEVVNQTGLLFLVVLLACGFFAVLFDWNKMSFFYRVFSFAKVFNLKRFISLVPGLFFISLLFTFCLLNKRKSAVMHLVTVISLIGLFVLEWRGNIARDRSSFDCKGMTTKADDPNTFDQFFNESVYRQIKKDIGKDSLNNVISYGLLPSPCKYAGLHVLDDYQGDYPLEYKQQFRKVIAKEIDKSAALRDYFDGWGSKCYMHSAAEYENHLENKYNFPYDPKLEINTEQLIEMNCHYILSAVVIGNAKELHLEFQRAYVSPIDKGCILLYKLV